VIIDLHPYEPSHPVHCSCNRAESLTWFERFVAPTVIVRSNRKDCEPERSVNAGRSGCNSAPIGD
jgi:hypothetical protein